MKTIRSPFFQCCAFLAAYLTCAHGEGFPAGYSLTVLGTGNGALLGSDLTDPENDINDSTAAGTGFNWFSATSSSTASFGGENALNIFDNKLGGDKWCCNPAPQSLTLEFSANVRITHFTISSGNDSPERRPLDWEIAGSTDGENFTPIFLWMAPADDSIWTADDQVIRIDLPAASPAYKYIRYVVARTVSGHQLGELELFGTAGSTDNDGDGLLNAWETLHGLNPDDQDTDNDTILDGLEDEDGDGLNNLSEQTRKTNPASPDSDADGLTDFVETDTGTWVGVLTDTGTDPNNADSDGDTLTDGVENPDLPFADASQPGSDPNLRDSDGDVIPDPVEVDQNTDPGDAAKTIDGVRLSVLGIGQDALLGSDLTDPENDIDDSIPAGANFNWVSSAATMNYFNGAGALNVFDNKIDGDIDRWYSEGNVLPQSVTTEFAGPVAISHFTLASSGGPAVRWPKEWQLEGSNDDSVFSPILTWNTTSDLSVWTADGQVIHFTLAAPALAYKFIRFTVLRAHDQANQLELGEIEYFTGAAPVGDIAVTAFSRDPSGSPLSITWTSVPGKTYTLEYSTNLAGFPGVVSAALPAHGVAATTTHVFPNPVPGAARLFFRIKQNQ